MKNFLPEAAHPWIESITLGLQMFGILFGAWLMSLLMRRLIRRIGQHHSLPPELLIGTRRVAGFVIYVVALLLVLDLFGVSATVLWTALTGFAAVAAVAFFAAWSVLSNVFCTLLLVTTRPFRLYDHIEVLENGEKPGLKGKVVDINLIHTTLQEKLPDGSDTVLQVPNSLFFQRIVRRWRGEPAPVPAASALEDESRV